MELNPNRNRLGVLPGEEVPTVPLSDIGQPVNRGPMKPKPAEDAMGTLPRPQNPGPVGGPVQVPPPGDVTTQQAPAAGPRTGPYGITWGDAVTDPAEQQRILGLAEDFVRRNEAGSGLGAGMYQPGHSREEAIQQAAYSFFPTRSGGAVGAGGSTVGTGTGGTGGGFGPFVPPNPTEDAYTRFRMQEGQRGIEHSAAARGTLLGTGTLRAIERYRQGVASEEAQHQFDRALATYNANRQTAAQNAATAPPPVQNIPYATSGPNMDDLYGRLPGGGVSTQVSGPAPTEGSDYADMVASVRAANEAESARLRGPVAPLPGYVPRRLEVR